MNKNIIIAFVLGIILTAFSFHAYEVYQLKKVVQANSTDIKAIIDFINKATTK